MNADQIAAAAAVERHKARVRTLASQLDAAQRTLKRAEAQLRKAARDDPDSWNSVTALPAPR